MLTIPEYLELKPDIIHLHALDALRYILEGHKRSAYGRTPTPGDIATRQRLIDALDATLKHDNGFSLAVDESYRPHFKKKPVEDKDYGDLNIDRHINGQEKRFDDYRKKVTRQPALTIFMEGGIFCNDVPNYGNPDDQPLESSYSLMRRRHYCTYHLALDAEINNRPCRVITGTADRIADDDDNERLILSFLTLKDYADPIFPGLWAAYRNNLTTWAFECGYLAYIVGSTRCGLSNRPHSPVLIDDHMNGDEFIMLDPRDFRTEHGTVIDTKKYIQDKGVNINEPTINE